MGQPRSPGIREVRHRPLDDWAAGVEVLALRTLPSRASAAELAAVQRLAFHQVLLVERGRLHHTVDVAEHALRPGQWLWVRPGQVQRWHGTADVDGTLVVFDAALLAPEVVELAQVDAPDVPAVWSPAGEAAAPVRQALDHLVLEFDRRDLPPDVRRVALRRALELLVLRLASLPHEATGAVQASEVLAAFRDAVERDFTTTRRLDDYARTLAYAPRTLSRATVDAMGLSAKAFIDRRVILEARRLLAHTDRPVAQVARELGFSSATNFGKFFLRNTGETPNGFRSAWRPGRR